jgi:hypothetical protein
VDVASVRAAARLFMFRSLERSPPLPHSASSITLYTLQPGLHSSAVHTEAGAFDWPVHSVARGAGRWPPQRRHQPQKSRLIESLSQALWSLSFRSPWCPPFVETSRHGLNRPSCSLAAVYTKGPEGYHSLRKSYPISQMEGMEKHRSHDRTTPAKPSSWPPDLQPSKRQHALRHALEEYVPLLPLSN